MTRLSRITRNTKLWIFDLDDTLIETEPMTHVVFNNILMENGHSPISLQEHRRLRRQYEAPSEMVRQRFGLSPKAYFEDFNTAVERDLLDHIEEGNVVRYTGAEELIQVLIDDGVTVACVTNATRNYTRTVFDRLDMESWFETVITGDDVEEKKPNPEGLLEVVDDSDYQPSDCVYVGNSAADLAAAESAKIEMIQVLRQFEARHADVTVESLDSLLSQYKWLDS